MQIVVICFSYLLSTALLSLYLKRLEYSFLRVGRWILGVSIALHWGMIISGFVKSKIFLPANSLESLIIMLGVAGFLCGILSARKRFIGLVTFALPIISVGLALAGYFENKQSPISLPNPWLWTHIVLSILGDGLLFFASLISLVYVLVDFQLRHRVNVPLFSRQPSLADLDMALGESLLTGFVLLTLGLITGVFFAGKYWAGIWILDPKILFSLLVWVLYALVLGLRRYSAVYRGRRSALLSLVGFLAILFFSLVIPSEHHSTSPSSESETHLK
jgi:ABC-type uncharacterized transport system permease subunit